MAQEMLACQICPHVRVRSCTKQRSPSSVAPNLVMSPPPTSFCYSSRRLQAQARMFTDPGNWTTREEHVSLNRVSVDAVRMGAWRSKARSLVSSDRRKMAYAADETCHWSLAGRPGRQVAMEKSVDNSLETNEAQTCESDYCING